MVAVDRYGLHREMTSQRAFRAPDLYQLDAE
jgi:hypothetical protein